MTKREVLGLMGKPATVRQTVEKDNGKPVEVWAYANKSKSPKRARDVVRNVFRFGLGSLEKRRTYFHFIDGRLTQWGPANAAPPN